MTTRLGIFLFIGLLLGGLLGYFWLGSPVVWAILFGVLGLVVGGTLDFIGYKAMESGMFDDEEDESHEDQRRAEAEQMLDKEDL